MTEASKLMTAAEVSTYLGGHVSAARIQKACRDGLLVATRIGRTRLFTRDDIDAWLDACRSVPAGGISLRKTPR